MSCFILSRALVLSSSESMGLKTTTSSYLRKSYLRSKFWDDYSIPGVRPQTLGVETWHRKAGSELQDCVFDLRTDPFVLQVGQQLDYE